MPKIINLVSMSGADVGHAPGDEIEVDAETAKERVAAGVAAWPEGSAEAKAAAAAEAKAAKAAEQAAPPAETPPTEEVPAPTEEAAPTEEPAAPATKATTKRAGSTVETASVEPAPEQRD